MLSKFLCLAQLYEIGPSTAPHLAKRTIMYAKLSMKLLPLQYKVDIRMLRFNTNKK